MAENNIDILFDDACQRAAAYTKAIPPDVRLRIYAYYKQATQGDIRFMNTDDMDLVSAFKMNAWMQVRHLSADEAKLKYVETINLLTK